MNLTEIILIVVGLMLFEVINSVDNAIINAEVLSTMGQKSRKWFLLWGIIISVFLVRGLLPLLIVWASVPGIGIIGAFTAAFSSDPAVHSAVDAAAPILLMGGGTFLIFLFLHWLFLEPKKFGLAGEKFFLDNGIWFFACASVFLAVLEWFALKQESLMAFGAVLGSTAFFITEGFKQNAEQAEKKLLDKGTLSDLSKILYLEIIDATFSIDGVLGAFAFTLSVPLIIIGNGLGSVVVRQLTAGNIDRIKRFPFLKNGAMYSILALGTVMIADGFGSDVPSWVSPVITFVIIGYFFFKSVRGKTKLELTLN